MKKLLTVSFVSLLALSSTSVFAGKSHHRNGSFEDTARVTHVEPIYRSVRVATPQRLCSPRTYRQGMDQQQSYTTTIAGSILGGIVGNQFGGGSGKKIMTVAGAVLGGSVGRDLRNQPSNRPHYNRGEECHVSNRYHHEERIDGYNVTYKYQGQTYTTQMDYDPGRRLPIEVSVRPAAYRAHY